MAFTPVEIRHVKPSRSLVRGYDRGTVDRLLTEIADSFETVWRERADLSDKVERMEEEIVRYRELDSLLRTTLVTAERAAHEVKDHAKREAETMLGEARAEARAIVREAASERDALLAEARRIRALLEAALAAAGAAGGTDAPAPGGGSDGETAEGLREAEAA